MNLLFLRHLVCLIQGHKLQNHFSDAVFDKMLIQRYDVSGPRYTSYPTADRFVDAFDAAACKAWLARRRVGGIGRALSLYVHIPFCDTVCYYCACNKIVTGNHRRSAEYVRYLGKEIALVSSALQDADDVVQLHWGGGTPTFLSDDEIFELMEYLHGSFRFAAQGEYSIELDPRTVDRSRVALLGQAGFNRMSVGVQDFTREVQEAVNRIQSVKQTREVIETARCSGFKSVSVDLIYGLPLQNVISFNHSLDEVIKLAPDRVSLYNYAHLPGLFKPQRRIKVEELPSAEDKLQILQLAIRHLTDAGYVYIGMDHFALPGDELAVAQHQGRLHRNFQGYSTHADSDLLAFGVSAIGKVGPCYAQNYRTIDEYYDCLNRDELPVMRGLELTADDLLRRSIIQALMCHFEVSIESIEIAHLIHFREYFAAELADLREMEQAGLIEISPQWLSVLPRGRMLVRAIAMVFDKYLRHDRERTRYSRII